jgi:signal transduction histidine kinase
MAMAVGKPSSPIADLLEARCDEIAQRFVERAQGAGASTSLSRDDIIDSLREYLLTLARRLRSDQSAAREELVKNDIAGVHGQQRFHLGYDVGALVREYGALRELLWDVIMESGVEVRLPELRRLFMHVTHNIADAAVQYGAARDAEMRRRTAQHLAFLAHELRNPLSSARMALSLMRERGDVEPSRALEALERGLTRVGHLIDDSLVSARLGELIQLECSAIDVASFLGDVARESEVDAVAKDVSLRVAGGGRLYGDVRSLHSAVSNLVRNAVKFTRAGAVVDIRARHGDGRVIIEVEDACGGLPEGTTKKLFDPFVQIGNDKSGFGLGLAIAKQAVDAHGGQLRVHDLPGKGCVFVLDLPDAPMVRPVD